MCCNFIFIQLYKVFIIILHFCFDQIFIQQWFVKLSMNLYSFWVSIVDILIPVIFLCGYTPPKPLLMNSSGIIYSLCSFGYRLPSLQTKILLLVPFIELYLRTENFHICFYHEIFLFLLWLSLKILLNMIVLRASMVFKSL